MWKSKVYGAFVLNHRVVLHAIDATPARWRGDAASSPLGRARTAVSSPRNDIVKNCRVHPAHWLISTQVVAGFHAAMRSQKSIEQRARHAADDREALTSLLANMATVENVFDDACRDLTRPAIAARLEAATGKKPSEREVEILFDIFDASHNDKISLREARSALHRGDAHPLIT